MGSLVLGQVASDSAAAQSRRAPTLEVNGIEIRVEAIDYAGGKAQSQVNRMRLADQRLRIDPVEEGDQTTIFRGERNDFMIVDHQRETFVLMDQDGIDQLVAQVRASMKELDQQMKALPDEQRRMLLAAMLEEEQRAADTRLVQTNRKETKNGFDCVLFEVRQRDELIREVWVASWDQLPRAEIVRGALEGMEDFFGRLDESLSAVTSAAGGFDAGSLAGGSPFADLRKMQGFPIHSRDYVEGELVSETIVQSVVEAEMAGTIFAAPVQYERRAPFE